MKYTVTREEVKEAKVSPVTWLAITGFKKVLQAEKRVEKLEEELQGWLTQVPDEEVEVYAEITEEIRKREERK